MKFPRRKFLHLAAGAAALPAASRIASAQAYPSRPVRMIVPFAPAGSTDIVARLMGQWLSERLGQPLVIFLARLGLELARGLAFVGDEFPREHAFAAEGVFMAARHGQQIDQRIKVPKPVLDRGRRQHQHVAEAPFLERLFEAHKLRNLYGVDPASQVALREIERERDRQRRQQRHQRGAVGRKQERFAQ